MSEKITCVPAPDGMLAYLISRVRPTLAERIRQTGRIETAVIGLGGQGTRHAGLMKEFGTTVTAGIAPGQGGTTVCETVPVYESVAEMLRRHPDIAVVSVWKQYSTAAAAAIEAIDAGIPVVVLISEGMPIRDVRSVLVAARRKGTLVLGPNTPGIIFPPEHIKVGMLPDVFHPAEPEPGRFAPAGVTICSRSGAILYHMSDALASAGIAQNAVIGIGGDSAVSTTFPDIVPLVMAYPKTDLVVVAGEIGGCQEERLAEDIRAYRERYPKPLVALISGRCAPQGKTMGHAGAIVAPGSEYGTFASKKAALEAAGVTVVNSQYDLIEAVRKALGGRTYFLPERYYARMKETWEAPPPVPRWTTSITRVAPNDVAVRGKPLQTLIGKRSLLEVTGLLVTGRFPGKSELARLDKLARSAAALPVPNVPLRAGDDLSKQLAALLLGDTKLAAFDGPELDRAVFCLGRAAAGLCRIFKVPVKPAKSFALLACRAVAGRASLSEREAKMLEAAMVACVDHGVTAPSTQTAILLSTVRAALEVAVAGGINAITDVHGGAGANAAQFFRECAELAHREKLSPRAAAEKLIAERMAAGARIEGLGHRLHTRDPRRDALYKMAKETRLAGECVELSKIVSDAFKTVRGLTLPINVDGVIGAIVADMGLDPRAAKALFVYGRIAGLAAHHFEEISTQPAMRRVDFAQAVYKPAAGPV
ncbi:citrate/2-methylcitrate synthase [Zavarzinia sp.]|uniref:citrate/2-methylcitrate synthase n=1 Tax=Zavarzinia sp. TaxID=2027920 RepID=UPI003565BD43